MNQSPVGRCCRRFIRKLARSVSFIIEFRYLRLSRVIEAEFFFLPLSSAVFLLRPSGNLSMATVPYIGLCAEEADCGGSDLLISDASQKRKCSIDPHSVQYCHRNFALDGNIPHIWPFEIANFCVLLYLMPSSGPDHFLSKKLQFFAGAVDSPLAEAIAN